MKISQGSGWAAVLTATLLLTLPAWGQNTINARITGGGGSGKCTFEVRVDGVADVQIRYNQGYLQTRAGQQATWKRLQCNQPLPRNPMNFRFKGIDGRGKQYLLRDPNQNNGVAVIRIEDPKSGYEGYTGDILWNGSGGGGNWNGGGNWWNDDWNGGGGWGPPPPPPGGGNWSRNVIPNCQNDIRRKLVSQGGGSVNFSRQPSTNPAGSFIMVQGAAGYRDGRGNVSDVQYNCTMHPNGNVAESRYNFQNPNYRPQPR